MQRLPEPGAPVWLRQQRWRIERARRERRVVRLDVSNATARLTVLTPYDRVQILAPRHRPVRVRVQRSVARLAHLVGSAPGPGVVHTLIESRLDLWPYQVEPALAVRDGRRRLLIADEVGLGKTIEAGVILAETLRRDPSARALVVAPAGLCRQWTEELSRHFGIEALRVNDRESLIARHGPESSPWPLPGVCLASVDYLKQPHVFSTLPPDPWDVVVIDEVHLATGRSDRHDTCDEIGRRARVLVMLSATPHDGDAARYARLRRLGCLPGGDDSLVVFRRTRRHLALPIHRVVRWHAVRPHRATTALLTELARFERVVLAGATSTGHDDALLFLAVLRKRALSSAVAVERTLARRLAWLSTRSAPPPPDWRQPTLQFTDDTDEDDASCIDLHAGMTPARERGWLARLRALAAKAAHHDPKLHRLRTLVARTAEPVVVFTEYRDTLDAIAPVVAAHRTTAVIHGGQDAQTQHDEIERFLCGTASAVVATDVASQGLNLQSRARWVIAMDLPWNPIRLEQRIGRLDRLGQRRPVHATLLVNGTAAERSVLVPMLRRTLTAQRQFDDDVLGSITPPPRLVVASAMIERDRNADLMLPPICTEAATPATEYRRRARAHTRVAARRRRLLRQWRGGGAWGTRPMRLRLPVVAGRRPAGVVVVMAIPIVDGTGAVVERRLLAVVATHPPRHADDVRAMAAGAMQAAAKGLHRRLDRLRHLVQAATARRLSTERALATHLHGWRYPRMAQPGLFSQRISRTFDDERRLADIGAARIERRIEGEEARGRFTLGEPSIVWIAERR